MQELSNEMHGVGEGGQGGLWGRKWKPGEGICEAAHPINLHGEPMQIEGPIKLSDCKVNSEVGARETPMGEAPCKALGW